MRKKDVALLTLDSSLPNRGEGGLMADGKKEVARLKKSSTGPKTLQGKLNVSRNAKLQGSSRVQVNIGGNQVNVTR